MGDPLALQLTAAGPMAGSGCVLLMRDVPVDGPLPLAAARNAGAVAALAAGCGRADLPRCRLRSVAATGRGLYRAVRAEARPALHCGVVQYLDEDVDAMTIHPAELAGRPHVARPQPEPGVSTASDDWQLFWSLSFAVSNLTWATTGWLLRGLPGLRRRRYRLRLSRISVRGQRAVARRGGRVPPVPRVAESTGAAPCRHRPERDIFHRRWGFWPMQGWLQAFCEMGLASTTRNWISGRSWKRTRSPPEMDVSVVIPYYNDQRLLTLLLSPCPAAV